MDNRPIGVFDSGVGGLTVVKEILRILPQEKIIYLGDTARIPWGTRGKKVVIEFSSQMANFLIKKKVKLIVVACHTASSVALTSLQKKFKVPVIGVIESSAIKAISKTKNLKVGLIGTPTTIKSNAWQKALKKANPKVEVLTTACPLFVPLAEEGLINHPATKLMAKEYLEKWRQSKMDVLILACTHYPLLQKPIKQVLGKVLLVNPGFSTAQFLKDYLKSKKILGNHQKPSHEFYFTDPGYRSLDNLKLFFKGMKGVRIKEAKLKDL